jgi:hypothetical protein
MSIDNQNHEFIIEELDEERVVVKENMVALLKQKLEDVRSSLPIPLACYALCITRVLLTHHQLCSA